MKGFQALSCCLHIASRHLDRPVSDEVLRVLGPSGFEAALAALESDGDHGNDRRRQLERALEAARYKAGLARRQYDAVDPDNRLVVNELERRWNEQLIEVGHLEAQLAVLVEEANAGRFTPAERDRLLALGHDLPAAWNHPAASVEIKKRILRTVIHEIVAKVEGDRLDLLIHWQGGDHTALEVARKVRGFWRDPKAVEGEPQTRIVIEALARMLPDSNIAVVINRLGHRTVDGRTWNARRVETFRGKQGIERYRKGEMAERGEMMLDDVMKELDVGKMAVIRMIKKGKLPAVQICNGAPYLIRRQDLELPGIRRPLSKRIKSLRGA